MARTMCPRCSVRKKTSVGYCRPCNAARMKEYRIARKARFVSGELTHPARKECRRCGLSKQTADFSASYQTTDGLHYICKPCMSEQTNSINKQRRYGLSKEDIDRLRVEQGSRCAICCTPFELSKKTGGFHIDHNHTSGAVRGLLCPLCNLALGMFGDDKQRIGLAIAYLRRAGKSHEA
jgi:hypothetical protein